ncbi:sulfate ABC transporter substrate-binding protein [Leptolyngbya sp. NIES-2104]|uniref:sulfate ABC transporter substrate-binding protein n=1 Tax=Leptolyngbya sp. NIES-2104 TaxID=1552121 RepID=UPI0006ECA410|nr:sulfate ABC transporter substrate-binding protein [Leptolyngbya sp. NIES-2104]GAP97417.1 sulfate and thiosulfate binding protein CysP [Leptolyngbya sp. NIES-2104]
MRGWRFEIDWARFAQAFQRIWAKQSLRKSVSLFVVGATLSFAIAACSSGNNASNPTAGGNASPVANQSRDVELTLVGYAIPKAAHDAIIPKFVEQWKRDKGQNVTFKQSYGGSGSQTRAIIDGLEADITHLALAADTGKLVKAGLVNADWETKAPNNGTVAKTVAAIVTRPGNPKGIKTFQDLTRSDVKWVTPDPKTSGGARWNFLVLWNDALKRNNNDEAKAKEFVAQAYKNVAVLAKDAREATDAFSKQGQGDALIQYENEVILAKQKGEQLDYVAPDTNISIDTPIAIVDKNVDKHGTREVAEAFVKYLFTPEAQAEFLKLGFRPLDAASAAKADTAKLPEVETLASIKDFGGWDAAQKKFFEDGGVFDQTLASAKQ